MGAANLDCCQSGIEQKGSQQRVVRVAQFWGCVVWKDRVQIEVPDSLCKDACVKVLGMWREKMTRTLILLQGDFDLALSEKLVRHLAYGLSNLQCHVGVLLDIFPVDRVLICRVILERIAI